MPLTSINLVPLASARVYQYDFAGEHS
jgi:hypothetical protein